MLSPATVYPWAVGCCACKIGSQYACKGTYIKSEDMTRKSFGVLDMQGIVESAESKIKEVEHRGKDVFGNAKERFFEKKSDVIDVHKGDTLWGISQKYGVSFLVRFSLLSIWSHCICMLEILL
jgi:hypothetical protein